MHSFTDLSQSHPEPSTTSENTLASTHPKKISGRKKFRETRHPVYHGVRRRDNDKWVCEVREPNTKTRIWLGTHPTAEMAARANDVAVIALRGTSACLNFADSAWRLPVPASANVKDIQKAAAEAAEAFRPRKQGLEGTLESALAAAEEMAKEAEEREEELMMWRNIMMMSPTHYLESAHGYDDVEYDDDDDDDGEVPLWNYL